jgi:hypothetical protein
MDASKCQPGLRVVMNSNLGNEHSKRLVPGMVGTIKTTYDEAAEIEFDQPMLCEFYKSWTVANVRYERFDPAPEGAIDFVALDSQ